jgi:murein tripeptide amidase MpaA
MRFLALLALATLPALAQPSIPPGPYQGHMVVRVSPADQDQLESVFDMVTGVWSCRIGPGPIDVQVTRAQRDALEAAGFATELMVPDVQALVEQERQQIDQAHRERDAAWFSTFRTLTEVYARLDYYQQTYPALAQTFTAGQSIQARPIRGISITGPDQPGNPRSSRPAVFYNSCQHAREWATPMTTMWIADYLLENYATNASLRDIVDHCEIVVVPVSNPDGYEYTWTQGNRMWRKNRRDNGNGTFGVDNNRNWGFQWGIGGSSGATGDETYRGTAPFSEPETQALRDVFFNNPRVKAHIDIHSYSQLILTPWGYTIDDCPDRGIFASVESDMRDAIASVHGRVYTAGPTYTTIYPVSGGSLDWSYGDRGVLGMSIEVRDAGGYGFIMPAAEIIPNAQENFEGAMALARHAMRPLIIAPYGELPATVTNEAPATLGVHVWGASSTLAGVPQLMYRISQGPWTPVDMTLAGPRLYSAQLPVMSCGQSADYYFRATATSGQAITYPEGGEGEALTIRGVEAAQVFFDDMEIDRGWTVGAPTDTATAPGRWQWADPEPTAAQPGDDATPAPGALCWITGAAAGASIGTNDVDGGETTLTSPVFSMLPTRFTRVEETRVSYARWYSNNQGSAPNADTMGVFISNNGGTTWYLLEGVATNAGQWVRPSFTVGGFVAPTATMRLRFVASDLGAGSIVEAGVDDVRVQIIGCAPDLDLNQDGNADQDDVTYLINVVAGGANPTGIDPDFNQDGSVDQDDVADFIRALSGG